MYICIYIYVCMYGCMNSMSTIYNPTNRKKKTIPYQHCATLHPLCALPRSCGVTRLPLSIWRVVYPTQLDWHPNILMEIWDI